MKRLSANQFIGMAIGFAWLASWVAAGPLIRGLRDWGIMLPRGLVVASGLSELLFSLVVLSMLVAAWTVGVLVVRPFLGAAAWRGRDAGLVRLAELREKKTQLLNAMRELEFDQAMGKVSASDQKLLGDRIRGEAAEVYSELDRIDPVGRYREQIQRDLERLLRK